MSLVNIIEEFSHSEGRFENYFAYDDTLLEQVREQRHTDLRNFVTAPHLVNRKLIHLDEFTIADTDGITMSNLSASQIVSLGEVWTSGTIAQDPALGNRYTLSLNCTAGAVATTASTDDPIDVSWASSVDALVVHVLGFNSANYNLASSFIDLTSNPNGDFVAGPTASLPFSASGGVINGDGVRTWQVGLITGIDLTRITGVRFRLLATTTTTFKATGVRVESNNSNYFNLEVDTRRGVLQKSLGPGAFNATPTYSLPTLFWAHTPVGNDDPQPFSSSFGITFNPGSLTSSNQSSPNTISLFLRAISLDYMTMLDLNYSGTPPDPTTMSELNALRTQPDYGMARFSRRDISEFDTLTMAFLDTGELADLERKPDLETAGWVEVKLSFWGGGAVGTKIDVVDTEANGYTFDQIAPPVANQEHIFIVELNDDSLRLRLYPLLPGGEIDTANMLYDTGTIIDDLVFRVRGGRVGWNVDLKEWDAYVDGIRPRSLVFGEYRIRPLESFTPVEGAQLFVGATPEINYFIGVDPAPGGGKIEIDPIKGGYKVTNDGSTPLQGLQTNEFILTSFENSYIEFNIWWPQSLINQRIEPEILLLSNTGLWVNLGLKGIRGDRWHQARITPVQLRSAQTGSYKLVILQPASRVATWWVDDIEICQQALAWEGRSTQNDAWGDCPATWMPFEETINKPHGGLLFPERADYLQIRGKALVQDARIDHVEVTPKYAELGRFIWEPPRGFEPKSPTPGFTAAQVSSLTYLFDAALSTDNGRILRYYWDMGDGATMIGSKFTHSYGRQGIYTVTLTVLDDETLAATSTRDITIV